MLLTPDTFVRAPLACMTNATAIIHVNPAMGAAFTQYTVEFGAGGSVAPCAPQRFVYVLEGEIDLQGERQEYHLQAGGYAYLPAGSAIRIASTRPARVQMIEKSYVPLPGGQTGKLKVLADDESKIKPRPLDGCPGVEVCVLLPEDPMFDFAVNTMTYQPGAALHMVEAHIMEHGLLMLAGGGIYRLGDRWYAVTAGDFIWVAPWCLQWFGALGQQPAKYLIYKDWNRY
jgi:(S)-ureidoglycine aminohydrolase